MIVQAVLLGTVAFIAQSEYALGTSLFSHPIATELFTGIVLGNVKTGIIIGAILKLAFVGSFSTGALTSPDVVTGGILGTASVIIAGAGTETTPLLGLPTVILTSISKNIYLGLLTPITNHEANNYAEEGNYKGVEHVHLFAGISLSSMLDVVVMISHMVGSNTIGDLLNMIPDFVQKRLSVVTGSIPALGFAMPTCLLINGQVAPYFFLGFTTASYLEIPATGVAISDAVSVVVVINIMDVRQLSLQTTAGEVEGDEES